jgi:hypothetical protein
VTLGAQMKTLADLRPLGDIAMQQGEGGAPKLAYKYPKPWLY